MNTVLTGMMLVFAIILLIILCVDFIIKAYVNYETLKHIRSLNKDRKLAEVEHKQAMAYEKTPIKGRKYGKRKKV